MTGVDRLLSNRHVGAGCTSKAWCQRAASGCTVQARGRTQSNLAQRSERLTRNPPGQRSLRILKSPHMWGYCAADISDNGTRRHAANGLHKDLRARTLRARSAHALGPRPIQPDPLTGAPTGEGARNAHAWSGGPAKPRPKRLSLECQRLGRAGYRHQLQKVGLSLSSGFQSHW